VTARPLVLAAQCATFSRMGIKTHCIKCIVTALFVSVGFSIPAAAQESTLDRLYQELAEADTATSARIEQQIITEWSNSGSAAMDLLMRRGRDALDDGAPDAAVEHFSALVDHAPDFAEGYYGRASSYYLLGLTGPALDDIRQALVLNPRHFEAMRGLALIMEELGRSADALELYEMILAMNPQSTEVNEAKARLQLQLEGQAL
jgi:tetratricopeptide (TPR) repeat protein